MKLNSENVNSVYEEVRAFFKGGAKADNKRYDRQIDRGESDRVSTRITASALFPKVKDLVPTALMLGDVMRDTGNTRGNCYEATAVAASYFKERMPGVKTTVVVAGSGSHAWLIVGEDPGKTTVRDFAEVSKDAPAFAVDVWAGICCQVGQYQNKFKTTMEEWQEAGKRVVTPNDTHHLPVSWGNGVFEAPLRSYDPASHDPESPRLSGEPMDKQAVLSAVRDQQRELESRFQAKREWISERIRLIAESPAEFLRDEKRQLQSRLQGNEPEQSREIARSRLTLLETDPAQYIQQEKDFVAGFKPEVEAVAVERERLQQVQRDRIGLRQSVAGPAAEAGSLASGSVQSSAHKRSRSPQPLNPRPLSPQPTQQHGASASVQLVQHDQPGDGKPPKKRRLGL